MALSHRNPSMVANDIAKTLRAAEKIPWGTEYQVGDNENTLHLHAW